MNTGLTTTTTAATTTATTTTATSTAKSVVLDKPLNDLTEDDISQLTREDCRRYLKLKGMRRPSWNKSQAIQQVICLKSLLEPCSSPVKGSHVRVPHLVAPTTLPCTNVASNSSSSVKELSPGNDEGSLSALAEDGGPNQPAGPPCLDTSTDSQCRLTSSNGKSILDRKKDAPHLPIGQMTIFYSGKVNVYDGLPVDKAKAIMHLAAKPIHFCQDEPSVGNLTHWRTPCKLPPSNVKFNEATQDIPTVQSLIAGREDIEGQANRQVSLQRYFEKRKDRGKFKVKRKIGSSSSGLEMYLNHHMMRVPVTIGQITQTNACSSSQFGIVPPVGSVADKQAKHSGLSVDLNDKV